MKKHTEIRFEEAIEQELIEDGFIKGDPKDFDREYALFPGDVISFIKDSQPNYWKKIEEYHGNKSSDVIIQSLSKELDSKGSLYVLRQGFKYFGINFKLANYKPNTNLNPAAWEDYKKNIIKIYRQVHFSKNNPALSIDIIIAVSGIPVVTLELKNPLSGQTVIDARISI
mgnify:CR=1 FL=1